VGMIFPGFLQLSIPAFRDLSCMFRQVGVYFACGLAYLGNFFFYFSLEIPLGMSWFEPL